MCFDVLRQSHQENQIRQTLTAIEKTKVSERRTLVNPFSETTPLLDDSSNDNNNGGTDSYTAMFQNKDEKSQVSFA